MFSTKVSWGYDLINFLGIPLSSYDTTYRQRRGDLIVADALARGGFAAGVGTVGLSSDAAPLTYIHSTQSLPISNPNKGLSYAAPSGTSRQASTLIETTEHVMTIKSVVLNGNIANSNYSYVCPAGNLVFDNGQEFTKDNLHKLLIAYWQVTWGP